MRVRYAKIKKKLVFMVVQTFMTKIPMHKPD